MALEWDFTLPGEVSAPAPSVADQHRVLDNFRAMPKVGDTLMVFCLGCGDPMPLTEALSHGCDLPPAGEL
jgi:hypothetical protein